MSFDYQLMNVVGFTAYSVYNAGLYYNKEIQEEYEAAHDGKPSVVQANDVFFALHAIFWTVLTFAQTFYYDRGEQKVSKGAWLICGISSAVFVVYAATLAGGAHGSIFTWLDFVYTLSYIKLGVTLIKYAPQVHLNWQRKATLGFNIWNVLLDFTGGFLSVVQLLVDCGTTNNWEGISGDPVKFALGFTSMVFDTIFMTQHYYVYAANNAAIESKERRRKAQLGGAVAASMDKVLLPGSSGGSGVEEGEGGSDEVLHTTSGVAGVVGLHGVINAGIGAGTDAEETVPLVHHRGAGGSDSTSVEVRTASSGSR
jgi:LCT (Lysosomal Cystine Transporter) family transporter